jgi:hypothetical protein
MTCELLAKKLKQFHRLTGLNLEEFDELYDKFHNSWDLFITIACGLHN